MRYHVNGDLVPADEAAVSVRDRGFLYGDAGFETLRAYGGTVFEWDTHRDRLAVTCETLGMPDAVPEDLLDRIRETLAANDLADAYVRVTVSRGAQPGRLTPRVEVDPGVVVIVEELPRGGEGGDPVWDGPATLRTVETRRIPDECLPAAAKTHNYLNGILARLELREAARDADGDGTPDGDPDGRAGGDGDGTGGRPAARPVADEALLRDVDGSVAEGTTSNLFFVADGTLHTPSLDGPVLPGVTRAVVLDLAADAGIPVETGRYRLDDVLAADECFLTNTTWELRPVESVDGRRIGEREARGDAGFGPVAGRLAARFDRRVEACYGERS